MSDQQARIDAVIGDLKVIDTDTHLSEPYDLWTARAPARYRDLVPQVREIDGRKTWIVNGDIKLGFATAASVVRRDGSKALGTEFYGFTLADVHEASHSVKPRLAMMDKTGIWAQIIYPNLAGFGNQRFLKVEDAELRRACVTIYNDFCAQFQEESGNRILPMALVPWWDIPAAIEEVRRASRMGLRGIVTCSDPDTAGLPDYSDAQWNPFWEACADEKMPINFHIGASDRSMSFVGRAPWPTMGRELKLAVTSANLFLDNARVIGNLILTGVLERHPDCKFVSVESGIGWVPFFLEALDHQMNETAPNECASLKLKPSEYFRRQFYTCFWFESVGVRKLLDDVGVCNVMFETDFPHPTSLYPNNQQHVVNVMGDLDAYTRRRVLQDNAAELYRIPLSS